MRCEAEVRAKVEVGESELRALAQEIAQLTQQVKVGDDGWRTALEALAARIERRHILSNNVEGLRWVLTADMELLAS